MTCAFPYSFYIVSKSPCLQYIETYGPAVLLKTEIVQSETICPGSRYLIYQQACNVFPITPYSAMVQEAPSRLDSQ